jgi:hypothetical protein
MENMARKKIHVKSLNKENLNPRNNVSYRVSTMVGKFLKHAK